MSLDDQENIRTHELTATGSETIFTGATVVSTDAGTKTVVLSGVDLFRAPEELESGDKVTLSGTSGGAGDGTFTVDVVTALDTFTVQEAIGTSTGGFCDALFRSGARLTGFDPTGLSQTTATNVQDAITDLDGAITGGGLTEAQHDVLDDLVHNIAETCYEEITRSGGRITAITIWETSSKLKKVREVLITRSGGKVSQLDLVQYNAAGAEQQRMVGVLTRIGRRVGSIAWTETGN